jgi:hypothetical protein
MKTAWNAADRGNLQDRLMALGPGSHPRWVRLSDEEPWSEIVSSCFILSSRHRKKRRSVGI